MVGWLGMNDRMVGKHCGIVFSFLRSNEETKTWMRRASLLLTVRDLLTVRPECSWIIKCIELRIRNTLIVQRSKLLYTLFDMFQEKLQRSSLRTTPSNVLYSAPERVESWGCAFFHCSVTAGRILPGRCPDDSHGVVTSSSQPGTHRALCLTCYSQIHYYYLTLLVVNNDFVENQFKISGVQKRLSLCFGRISD